MAVIAFVTYEIHPTTRGGCGVLLHHAAELLLRRGHEVVFLLAAPAHEFERFDGTDRLAFPNPDRCRAYHLDALAHDFAVRPEECPSRSMWEASRFAHAWSRLASLERIDAVEFFEYCGVSHYAAMRRLFGTEPASPGGGRPVLASRLHNSLELIDRVGGTKHLDRARYHLYGLERAGLRFAEAVLTPTWAYFDAYYRDAYAIPRGKAVLSQSPKLATPRVARRPDPGEPFTIAYVGRMFQFKGVDQLVHAGVELLRRRPDRPCTFDVIGPDGGESPFGDSFITYLRSLIPAAMRDRFVFPGHRSHAEILQRLERALFAVFPNRFESFCYAAHEVYDAGVPVIVNDIPGWRDFFEHERNALVYDGRTDSLVGAMERLIDDATLRERLVRPHAIADRPLGEFYDSPRALAPIVERPGAALPGALAVVLCEGSFETADPTLRALAAQAHPPARTVVLVASAPDGEATFWCLGRSWHARDASGNPLMPEELPTLDAIVLLRAGDRPGAGWLRACATALAHRPSLGYAGTWGRRGGVTFVPLVDIAPETIPFEQGSMLQRVLIRTAPGRLLIDLFDPALGNLGEVGLLWRAWAETGPGAVLDEPMIDLANDGPSHAEPNLLKHLVMRHGAPFAERLSVFAGLVHDRAEGLATQVRALAPGALIHVDPSLLSPEPSHEHKVQLADQLGTRTLARLTWNKLARKVAGRLSRRR